MKNQEMLMYGGLALGAYFLYAKGKAVAPVTPTSSPDAGYVIPNTPSGDAILATPIDTSISAQAYYPSYIQPPTAPINYGQGISTPWGNVLPSFGSPGTTTNPDGTPVITPPAGSTGALNITFQKAGDNGASWRLLKATVNSGGVDYTYRYTYTFPEGVNKAQGLQSGVPKEFGTRRNDDTNWYYVAGLTLPRAITVNVLSDPTKGGNGATGQATLTLTE